MADLTVFSPRISFSGRRRLIVKESTWDVQEFFVFEGTKVKVDKGTITWSIYSFLAGHLRALQTGWKNGQHKFPVPHFIDSNADTLLALVIKSTLICKAYT